MSSSVAAGAAPRSGLIVRRRLIDRLRRRFDARLTLVVGGAGCGKTTLLAHAMSDESDHLDIWYPCRVADHAENRLLDGLVRACSTAIGTPVETAIHPPLEELAEIVLAQSPRQVCFVIDDTQLLGGAKAIEQLLDALPMNGHVLVAGRVRPSIATSRLDAAGQLEVIEQEELLLTSEEIIDFANLRGVDVSMLAGAGGWPAFVELASSGKDARTLSYLDEQALLGIDAQRRSQLAAFVFVGGGDQDVAQAVCGTSLAKLVADLPLVRWSGETAQLHDLWYDLLVPAMSVDQRRTAALTAAAIARKQRDIDRALDLASEVNDVSDAMKSIRHALIEGIDGGIQADQMRRWRGHIPPEENGSPVAILLDGLLERERDPTSARAFDLLDAASLQFAQSGDADLELTALTQLGYVTRIAGDPIATKQVSDRFELLAERYPPAQPFLAIAAAWTALTLGDPASQLAALTSISDDALPQTWQITRRHLIAHALFNLGRAAEGLEIVPTDINTLPVPIPGALVTESQCLWYSGQPHLAIANPPRGSSDQHGARDRFIAAAWESLMCCFSGDVETARAAAGAARVHSGEQPAGLIAAQLIGLETLIMFAEGKEQEAAESLSAILDLVPLGHGLVEQLFRQNFPLLYIWVPETRAFWDGVAMPGTLAEIRQIVQAYVAARRGNLGALELVDWPSSGLVAAYLPVRSAIELSLLGARANRQEARLLAAWLCEHWQRPARDALASWVEDDMLGETARDILTHTPTPPRQEIQIQVLGDVDVHVEGSATADPNWRRERVQALLAWLVLNPNTSRDSAATAVWPDLDRNKCAKNLRTTLNYLHRVLEPSRRAGDAPWFIRSIGQRLTLHGSADVDLRRIRSLLDRAELAERDGHPREALPLLLQVLDDWNGDLAVNLDYEWLELERIHVRSRYVRAACRAAELLVATGQANQAIAAVRPALDIDPFHERSYRALADAYRSIDDHTSARAVLERGAQQLGYTFD